MKTFILVLFAVLAIGCATSNYAQRRNGLLERQYHAQVTPWSSDYQVDINDAKFPKYQAELGLPSTEGETLARQRIYIEEMRRNNSTLYGGYYGYWGGYSGWNQSLMYLPPARGRYVYPSNSPYVPIY
jgi:hypothetical protein